MDAKENDSFISLGAWLIVCLIESEGKNEIISSREKECVIHLLARTESQTIFTLFPKSPAKPQSPAIHHFK